MNKYTNSNGYINSNISFEDYIRLNNVTDQMIIDAADTIIEQEQALNEAYDKIEALEHIIQEFDVESINHEIDIMLNMTYIDTDKHLLNIKTLLDNFKQRRG